MRLLCRSLAQGCRSAASALMVGFAGQADVQRTKTARDLTLMPICGSASALCAVTSAWNNCHICALGFRPF